MTCKDCVHGHVCVHAKELGYDKSEKPIEIKCDDFENKSDFVNVVRCKDCKHCEKIIDQFDNDWYFCKETVNKAEVKSDDYCSRGERRRRNDG